MMKRSAPREKGPTQSNQSLKKLASKYEKYSHQNNMFNGKNLSDGSKVTQFYTVKAKPEEAFREIKVATQSRRQQASTFDQDLPVFTNNMLNHLYDDNTTIKVSKLPSNLVEVPKVNEKYEISSFFGPSPQYKENLRTLQLIKNNETDPIMNVNSIFFGKQDDTKLKFKDPFTEIMNKEHLWNQANQKSMVKDLIYHTDYDHPLSFHHQALHGGHPDYKVTFPSQVETSMKSATLVQNGFYAKESLTLENPYKPQENQFLFSLDERIFGADRESFKGTNVFQKENLLYKANEELSREIEIIRKEKEYQRLQREKQIAEAAKDYRIEEQSQPWPQPQPYINTEESKKSQGDRGEYSISPNKESQFSQAPRIEDQYTEEKGGSTFDQKSAKNIFSIKMDSQGDNDLDYNSSPEQAQMRPKGEFNDTLNANQYVDRRPIMDDYCRKDLPPAPQQQNFGQARRESQQQQNQHYSKSPPKSVRFDDQQNQSRAIPQDQEERKTSPSKQSHSKASAQEGEDSEEYYDQEEGDDEEEDEVLDQDIQNKLEQIKKNLNHTGSSTSQNKEESISKLEEVLRKQRERLENMTVSSKSLHGTQTQNEPINFDLSKTSPLGTGAKNTSNLEKAYEELEKEIIDIKSKLQKSLDYSKQHNETFKNDRSSRAIVGGGQRQTSTGQNERQSSIDRNASGRVHGRVSNTMKSPGDFDEHDYSLSVSDLNNSLYNTSGGGFGASSGHEMNPPRSKY